MEGWGSWTIVLWQATDMPFLWHRIPRWTYLHHQARCHGSSGFYQGLTTFCWSYYSGFSLTSHFLIPNQTTTSSCQCWSSSPTHRFSPSEKRLRLFWGTSDCLEFKQCKNVVLSTEFYTNRPKTDQIDPSSIQFDITQSTTEQHRSRNIELHSNYVIDF